ncbi:MAG TPA: hypothetical protein VGR43_05250 [Dehalococcoidia bacterium]|jgi:hypothetical protein|nr:hypothetical protein [Dehalococcoidia bacterium]
MTPEARLAFVVVFFAAWCFLGLIAWAVSAVIARGRGALPALPLALAAASAAGVAVPLAGLDDARGFFLSLATALLGGAIASAAGIRLAKKLGVAGLSTDSARSTVPPAQSVPQRSDVETE